MRRSFLFIVALLLALAVLPSTPPVQGADDAIAPQVVDTAPINGEELSPTGTVTLYFDQPMDRASVQAALKISPDAPGSLSWSNDSTAVFTPSAPLPHGTQYTFSLNTNAKSKNGMALRDSYLLRLRTSSDLQVIQGFPANGARDVEAQPTIIVIFNRPVVALGTIEDMAKLPSPIVISPDAQGIGTWTSTSIYSFKPSALLQGGKKYTVTIKKGLTDVTGSVLQNDITFGFTVALPKTIDISVERSDTDYIDPSRKNENVPRDAKLTVTFNQPMDTAATEVAFALAAGTKKVDGDFAWNDNKTSFTFTPTTLLDYATQYTVSVTGSAARSQGGAPLDKDATATITTLPLPDIQSTNPSDGVPADPSADFSIYFTAPMKLDDMKSRITFSPKPTLTDSDYSDPRGTYYNSGLGFDPSTDYTVTIDVNGLVDAYGTPFHADPNNKAYRIVAKNKLQIKYTTPGVFPDASLEFPGNLGLFSAYRPTTQVVASHVNVDEADLTLASIPTTDFLALEQDYRALQNYTPQNVVRQWSEPLTNDLDRRRYDVLTISAQGPGATAGTSGPFACAGAPTTQLSVGMMVSVLPDDPTPLRVRSAPGLSGSVITQVKPGGQFTIIGGPQCLDGYVWWNVKSLDGSITGWAAEGTTANYFLGPVNAVPTPTPPLDTSKSGKSLPAGAYLLQFDTIASATSSNNRYLMLVGTVGITLKVTPYTLIAWATDLQTGVPVAGAAVQFVHGTQNVGAPVKTDDNGLARLDLSTPLPPDSHSVYAIIDDGTNLGIGSTGWTNGLDAYSFSQNSDYSLKGLTVYLYSDRSIYEPGQPVYFKGIVRAQNDVTYTVPTLKSVPVTLMGTDGKVVTQQTAAVDAFGSFAGSFTLDPNVNLGDYTISVPLGTDGQPLQENSYPPFAHMISVAQYRLPEFQVKVNPAQAEMIQGDKSQATVDTTYFFGGAVKGAQVAWQIATSSYSFDYQGPGQYSFEDIDPDGSPSNGQQYYRGPYDPFVTSGEGTTDDQGKFVIDLPADLTKDGGPGFTVEADVTDQTAQTIAGTADFIVHPGEYVIGVGTDNYVGNASQPQQINLITVGWDSKPHPNADLNVTVVRRVWSSKQVPDPRTGQINWTTTVTNEPMAQDVVHTGDDGKATYSFTPTQGGIYRISATSRDSRGNQFTSSTDVWIAGEGAIPWRQDNNNQIDLKVDRDNYKIGDTASILIPSPFQGPAKALITIERGKLLSSEVMDISSASTIYKLPITADMAPNVYVSVFIVKGVDASNPVVAYRVGLAELNVETDRFKLNIAVTPDKPQAGPGENVNYKLKVTDYQGKPVEAEIGVALTDLASLSLKTDTSEPILQYFYGLQPLGVQTSSAFTIDVDQITEKLRAILDQLNKLGPVPNGGGLGGGGGGGGGGPESVRTKFIDTPLWSPFVQTDANGEASVNVTLPDNLTQWRLDARAATQPTGELNTTLVGQATYDLLSTKPLLVRPVTPRFFVIGDSTTLAAVVVNNTGTDQDVKVSIDLKGATLKGDADQDVKVAAGEQVRVDWQVDIPDVDKVDATFSAVSTDGKFSDAAKSDVALGDDQTLPVDRYDVPETSGTGGAIGKDGGSQTEGIVIPQRLSGTQGSLNIRIDPSLAASTNAALQVLKNEPYDTTEGTVSHFLPNLATYQALKKLNLANPDLTTSLTSAINFAEQKLETEQHKDGGWGWFVRDNSDMLVTSYVVIGMSAARDAGFQVDAGTLSRAANYLRTNLKIDTGPSVVAWQLNRDAFVVYALARAAAGGRAPVPAPSAAQLLSVRDKLSIYARAYLAMALHSINPQDKSTDTLISDIESRAIVSSTGVHWQEDFPDDFNWNTDTRTTSIVLEMFMEVQPTNPQAPDIVRWLMSARTADWWETSQETAWAVLALSSYMQISGELTPNYSYNIAFNDKALTSNQAVSTDTVQQSSTLQVAVKDMLVGQANRLTINRTGGDGVLYYTAHLNIYQPVEQVKALSKGISLSRSYSLMSDDTHAPITQAKVGDSIRVSLTIIVPQDLNYVMITDPIPAGTEAVNPDLATTGTIGQEPELDLTDPLDNGFGWWWFSDTELRTDKTVLYATFLPKGTYQFTYTLQATIAGQYHVIPATGQEQYFPEVYGRTDGAIFTLLPADGK